MPYDNPHNSLPPTPPVPPTPSILIIGEALVDCFADARVAGGAPFNVARNLAAFNLNPIMITRIGVDDNSKILLDEFDRFGLSMAGLQRDAVLPTGHVDVHFDAHSHRFDIAENAAWDALSTSLALDVTAQCQPKIICFGTLAQRAPQSQHAIAGVLDLAKTLGAVRVLDLNVRANLPDLATVDFSLRHADIVKVNDIELAQLLSWFVPGFAAGVVTRNPPPTRAGYHAAIKNLLQQYPLQQLIVTCGAEGYDVYDRRGTLIESGTPPETTVVDTVGAGDAFTSILIVGLVQRWPASLTFKRASYFAAAVCGLRGAVAADPNFYQQWATQWQLRQLRQPPQVTSATAPTLQHHH